jgi:hypothetical protein
MIDITLTYIRDILNEHFKNEFAISENKVILSNIVKADGSNAQNVEGKIVLFLISLEEESTLKNNSSRYSNQGEGLFGHKSPTLHLNMNLLFCANFDSNVYAEGLSYLSSLIRFFQINRKIILDQLGGSNPRTINFELTKLDYAELSHLWSAIGTKLMPSILYKVGLLPFDDVPLNKIIPAVMEHDN